VIRQAISCDICGAEKKQTNHWFVAYEQSGELRVSGWNSRNRLRPGSKHLCGQTCLHKLADDFMARTIAVRAQRAAVEEAVEEPQDTQSVYPRMGEGANPDVGQASGEVESSAQLLTPPAPILPKPAFRVQSGLVTMPGRLREDNFVPGENGPPRFASRRWRAQAWERERERTLPVVERRRTPA
jgi:hypothetical protein